MTAFSLLIRSLACLMTAGKPYRFQNPILKHETMVDLIRLNHTVLGRIMLYDRNQTINEIDYITFSHFSHIVALTFTHDKNYLLNQEATYSYFLQSLVDYPISIKDKEHPQISQMKLYLQHYKRVLIFAFIKEEASQPAKLSLAKQLRQLLGNAYFMFYDDKIVFLVSGQEKDFLQQKKEALYTFCHVTQLRLSTSHIFYEFYDFQEMYLQAREVERICSKYQLDGHLFSFRYLDSLIMLDSHRTSHRSFIHPDILQLLSHDRQKGTHLLETLANYILFNQQIDLIAKQMFLHTNTLRYRINNIKKILENDLNDWLLLKTYYDSLVQLFQTGDLENQSYILRNDLNFL